jgi:hypothetical protein
MMVRDLVQVERELGFTYHMDDGAHYQEICPKCRRALFGLAQGTPWRTHLSARVAAADGTAAPPSA